jgi:hypothetical protein
MTETDTDLQDDKNSRIGNYRNKTQVKRLQRQTKTKTETSPRGQRPPKTETDRPTGIDESKIFRSVPSRQQPQKCMIKIVHNNNNNKHRSSLRGKTFRELPCRKQIPKRIPLLYLFPHKKLEGRGFKKRMNLQAGAPQETIQS